MLNFAILFIFRPKRISCVPRHPVCKKFCFNNFPKFNFLDCHNRSNSRKIWKQKQQQWFWWQTRKVTARIKLTAVLINVPSRIIVLAADYLGHKFRSCIAEDFKHRSCMCIEQRHPTGNRIIHFQIMNRILLKCDITIRKCSITPSADIAKCTHTRLLINWPTYLELI